MSERDTNAKDYSKEMRNKEKKKNKQKKNIHRVKQTNGLIVTRKKTNEERNKIKFKKKKKRKNNSNTAIITIYSRASMHKYTQYSSMCIYAPSIPYSIHIYIVVTSNKMLWKNSIKEFRLICMSLCMLPYKYIRNTCAASDESGWESVCLYVYRDGMVRMYAWCLAYNIHTEDRRDPKFCMICIELFFFLPSSVSRNFLLFTFFYVINMVFFVWFIVELSPK